MDNVCGRLMHTFCPIQSTENFNSFERKIFSELKPISSMDGDEKVGTHAIDVDDELALGHSEFCINEALLFDEYCH